MQMFEKGPVYICRFAVDGRLGLPRLCELARRHARQDEPAWVVFQTRSRQSVKAVCCLKDSYLMFERRLSSGRYPAFFLAGTGEDDDVKPVTRAQLQVLFDYLPPVLDDKHQRHSREMIF